MIQDCKSKWPKGKVYTERNGRGNDQTEARGRRREAWVEEGIVTHTIMYRVMLSALRKQCCTRSWCFGARKLASFCLGHQLCSTAGWHQISVAYDLNANCCLIIRDPVRVHSSLCSEQALHFQFLVKGTSYKVKHKRNFFLTTISYLQESCGDRAKSSQTPLSSSSSSEGLVLLWDTFHHQETNTGTL